MDAISPELALVDEELDSSARESLPDAPDCLAPTDGGEPRLPARRRRLSRRALAALAGVAVLVTALGLAGVVSSHDRPPHALPGVEEEAAPTKTSRPGEQHRLRWDRVRGAAHYNVIFWRNGTRSLDLWPRTASLRVPAGRLAPGRYQWFVYPAFREKGKLRYGPVAARGTITV